MPSFNGGRREHGVATAYRSTLEGEDLSHSECIAIDNGPEKFWRNLGRNFKTMERVSADQRLTISGRSPTKVSVYQHHEVCLRSPLDGGVLGIEVDCCLDFVFVVKQTQTGGVVVLKVIQSVGLFVAINILSS